MTLQDLEAHLPDRPGALADLTQALGRAGVGLEGGGVFTVPGGPAVAHYLVHDGPLALRTARATGLGPTALHDVVLTRLDQDTPGQLGALTRLLGDAGVSIRVQYSDHDGGLVLLVDPEHLPACRTVLTRWEAPPHRPAPPRP